MCQSLPLGQRSAVLSTQSGSQNIGCGYNKYFSIFSSTATPASIHLRQRSGVSESPQTQIGPWVNYFLDSEDEGNSSEDGDFEIKRTQRIKERKLKKKAEEEKEKESTKEKESSAKKTDTVSKEVKPCRFYMREHVSLVSKETKKWMVRTNAVILI